GGQRELDVERVALLRPEPTEGLRRGPGPQRLRVEQDDVPAATQSQRPGQGRAGHAAAENRDHGTLTSPRPNRATSSYAQRTSTSATGRKNIQAARSVAVAIMVRAESDEGSPQGPRASATQIRPPTRPPS